MYRLKPKRQQEGLGLQVSRNVLSHFGVKHTNKNVASLLEGHVEYPSLLSLHDTDLWEHKDYELGDIKILPKKSRGKFIAFEIKKHY